MHPASTSEGLPKSPAGAEDFMNMHSTLNGQAANLSGIPPELLDEISFHVVITDDPSLGPPSGLLPLLLTCRRIQSSLSGSLSLYSRIFRAQFDMRALERRFPRDWLTSQVLVHELKRRWVVLRRIKRIASESRSHPASTPPVSSWRKDDIENLTNDLWTAFLMLLESDGRNREQLVKWANLETYLDGYVHGTLVPCQQRIGFQPENLEGSLVIWLSWLVTDEESLHHEQATKLADYMGLLRTVVFGVHKYDLYFAPWFYHDLPLQSDPNIQPPSRFQEFRRRAYEADLIPRNNAQRVPYLGRQLVVSAPIMAQAAILCFFLRLRKAEATGLGQIGSLARHPGNLNVSDLPEPPASVTHATDPDWQLDPTHGLGLFAPTHDSTTHDNDWDRLIACLSPYNDSFPVDRPFCRPGSLDGVWEGIFSFFDFDAYQDMLVGNAPANANQNQVILGQQPQVWRIREFHLVPSSSSYEVRKEEMQRTSRSPSLPSRSPNHNSEAGRSFTSRDSPAVEVEEFGPLPSGPPLNAHMPTGTRIEEVSDGIEVYQPNKRGCLFYKKASRVEPGKGDGSAPADPSGGLIDEPPPDPMAAPPDVSEAVLDILLTGSGHSAWGTFTLRGRVRPWDGLITLLKEYSGPQSRGQWLYRGYIHAGGNWVGRWRDTVTQLDYCGYEGCYAMRARR